MKGTIKTIRDKTFGFIRATNNGEYFFHREDFIGHWQDLILDFNEGIQIEVEFSVETMPKGPRARNVKRVDFPNEVA